MIDILNNTRFKFRRSTLVKADLQKVWDFFTKTDTIFQLTPDKMQLAAFNKKEEQIIYQGQIIDYWVTPILGIPIRWQTEIIDICPKEEFTDVQNIGPFGYWKHRHIFTETSVGVLIEDEVDYEMPIPLLTKIMDSFIVRQNLNELFDFRQQQLHKIFNSTLQTTS